MPDTSTSSSAATDYIFVSPEDRVLSPHLHPMDYGARCNFSGLGTQGYVCTREAGHDGRCEAGLTGFGIPSMTPYCASWVRPEGPDTLAVGAELRTLRTRVDELTVENDHLKSVQEQFARAVMNYDGCYDGRVEFLEGCGVTVPGVLRENETVVVSIAFKMASTTEHVRSLVEQVQGTLDRSDFVYGATAYVTNVHVEDDDPDDLAIDIDELNRTLADRRS